jgi:filamentous hemagglutinin family protein
MAILCVFTGTATAQIRTDGSLGPALTLSGPNFLISQSLGKLSGNNLFQSFATFNVGSGESATFVTTTPGLANVISRVTGGSASSINGVVRLSSTGATTGLLFHQSGWRDVRQGRAGRRARGVQREHRELREVSRRQLLRRPKSHEHAVGRGARSVRLSRQRPAQRSASGTVRR